MNLKLFTNELITLEEKIADYSYEKEEFLTFTGTHKIDLKSQVYEKFSEDLKFSVDFNRNSCIIILNGDKRCEFAIQSSLEYKNNEITLKYKLDEEEIKIKIKINLKEE